MAKYMLQHKSFSLFLFLCNMVLFAGLFSIPVFYIYYGGFFADKYTIIIEVIVLIPAVCLSYYFAREKENTPERDSVVIEGKDIIIGNGLFSIRPSPKPPASGPAQVTIDTDNVRWVELRRSSGSGTLGSFYELVLSSDQGIMAIPLNDWILRNLILLKNLQFNRS